MRLAVGEVSEVDFAYSTAAAPVIAAKAAATPESAGLQPLAITSVEAQSGAAAAAVSVRESPLWRGTRVTAGDSSRTRSSSSAPSTAFPPTNSTRVGWRSRMTRSVASVRLFLVASSTAALALTAASAAATPVSAAL